MIEMRANLLLSAGTAVAMAGSAVAGVGAVDHSIGDLPAGKAIIITHAVTIDAGTATTAITSQGTVTGTNFAEVPADDPDVADQNATITPVQQAPALADFAKAVTEDVAAPFALGEFEAAFNDPNGDMLQVLRILSLPMGGSLRLGGVEIVSAPADIPRANVATLSYEPDLNRNGADQFAWTASDGVTIAADSAFVNLAIAPVNDPPIAMDDVVDRFATQGVKIPVTALLANDSDPEGDTPLIVTGVTYLGGNGASVMLSGGIVFYDPGLHRGPDSIEYTVRDSLGAEATGVVTIAILSDDGPTLNITMIEFDGSGDAILTAAGIPGRAYRVQAADTGIPNWFDLPGATVVADAQGRISYTDPGPLPPARIYRIVHP